MIPSQVLSLSRLKPKVSKPSVPTQSLPGPSALFYPQADSGLYQPPPSAVKLGSHSGVIGKQQKPTHMCISLLPSDKNYQGQSHRVSNLSGTTCFGVVNLAEISPEEVGEDSGISLQRAYSGPGHGIDKAAGHGHAGQGKISYHYKMALGRKPVKRVFTASLPDPVEMGYAEKVLQDHENSLVDALSRLADISDSESDETDHEE